MFASNAAKRNAYAAAHYARLPVQSRATVRIRHRGGELRRFGRAECHRHVADRRVHLDARAYMERQLQPFADCVEPRHHISHSARLRFDAVDCAERIRRALRPAYELCVLRPQMRRCNEIDRTLLRCHIPYSCFALSPVTQYTHHSPRGIHLRAHIYRFPTPQPLLFLTLQPLLLPLLLRKKGQNRPSNCPELRRLEYARRHSAYLRKKRQK